MLFFPRDNSGYIFYPDSSLVLFDSTEMKYSLFYLYMIKPLPLNQCENIQNALQHHQMSPLEDDSPFGSASSSSGNKNFFLKLQYVRDHYIPVFPDDHDWRMNEIY